MKPTLPPGYFDDVYNANDDPWEFETSDYEKKKYAATIAALPKPHYEKGLEIGCSIGVLTAMLSRRCRHLLATDISEAPLRKARQRLAASRASGFSRQLFPAIIPKEHLTWW